jgi:DNA polymerase-3 subunit gamma/tau
VARLANGSMRDALSILDQLLSVAPQELTAAVLDELLPPAQDEQLLKLWQHAAAGEVAAVLADVDAVLNQGRGLENFCNDLIELVRTLMLIRACGVDASMVDVPAAARDEYAELSRRFELSQYVQVIAMLEELRRNVRYSGAGRALTDAVAVRLARMHAWTPIEQLLGQVSAESATGEKKKPGPGEPAPAGAPARASPGAVASSPAGVAAQATPVGTGRVAAVTPPAAAAVALQDAPPVSRFVPSVNPERTAAPPEGHRLQAGAAESGATGAPFPIAAPVCDPPPREAPLPTELPPDLELDTAPADIYVEPPGAPPFAAPSGRATITSADRAALERDPLVQRIVDLFDAELVYVERRPAAPPAPATE